MKPAAAYFTGWPLWCGALRTFSGHLRLSDPHLCEVYLVLCVLENYEWKLIL